MVAISFKSVGEKTEIRNQRVQNVEEVPIGIMTPLRSGDGQDGIFKMNRNLEEQIHDNFRNLLLTNHGDRVIQYDFGANLNPLVMEFAGQEPFESEAMLRVKRATNKFMPFVVLEDFETTTIRNNPGDSENVRGMSTGHIAIRIHYSVPQRQIRNKAIVVNFFLGG